MLGISTSTWGGIVLALIGIVGFVIRTRVQTGATKELIRDNTAKDLQLADLQREKEERAARHAKESDERAAAAKERYEERAQKEQLIEELRATNAKMFDFLKSRVEAQEAEDAKRYDIIERNTAALEKTAGTLVTMTSEMRSQDTRIGRLEGGSGCRA